MLHANQTQMHARHACSLISAVGIFCLGAGVSIVHGIHSMAHPAEAIDMTWGFAVLLFSTLVEGCTLLVAIRAVAAGARAAGMRFADFVKSGRDPVSVAIMAEDGAAVAGVIVAAVCTALVEHTGAAVWDGLGSVLVGLILGGVAIYLIQRNRSFLIGRAMLEGDFQKIVRHLKRDPVIKNIYEAKSEEIGEGIYRCAAPCPNSPAPSRSTALPRRVCMHACALQSMYTACTVLCVLRHEPADNIRRVPGSVMLVHRRWRAVPRTGGACAGSTRRSTLTARSCWSGTWSGRTSAT